MKHNKKQTINGITILRTVQIKYKSLYYIKQKKIGIHKNYTLT